MVQCMCARFLPVCSAAIELACLCKFFLTDDCTNFVGNIISFFRSSLAGSRQKRQSAAKSDLDSAVLLVRCLLLSLSLSPVLLGWHYSNCDGMIWHPVTTTLHVYLSWKTDKLLWLPIRKRIKYKVVCMCFSAINGSGPAYLSELLHVYTPSRIQNFFFLTHACWKSSNTNAKLMAFALFLALDPTFGKHDDTTETWLMVNFLILFCSLVFRTPISQISSSNTELSSRLDDCIDKLTIQNCLQTRHWQVNPQKNYYCQLHHASSSVRKRGNNYDKLKPAEGGGGRGGEKLH